MVSVTLCSCSAESCDGSRELRLLLCLQTQLQPAIACGFGVWGSPLHAPSVLDTFNYCSL